MIRAHHRGLLCHSIHGFDPFRRRADCPSDLESICLLSKLQQMLSREPLPLSTPRNCPFGASVAFGIRQI